MAWWIIEHSCGHTSEQQIYGPNVNGERERKAEWLGENPCPDCLQQQRNDRSRAAAKAEAALKVGQISREQFAELESDFARIALRLDCEWGS